MLHKIHEFGYFTPISICINKLIMLIVDKIKSFLINSYDSMQIFQYSPIIMYLSFAILFVSVVAGGNTKTKQIGSSLCNKLITLFSKFESYPSR